MEGKLRIVELFAGIGAQAMALEQLGIPFESTVCEIDRNAYASYCAIHGDTPNLGDITKVEHLPDCDLMTYSFPCQDLSVAGKRRGMSEGSGTRSSLLWEVSRLLMDAIEREREPEYLLMENVDAILFKANISDFERWVSMLSDMGYTSSYAVMNAKDYGVPQSRSRCFMVSRRNGWRFKFPKPCPDGRVLKDVLEDDVPEEYYLSDEKVATYERHRKRHLDKGDGFGWRPSEPIGMAFTIGTKPDRPNQNFIIMSGHIETDYDHSSRVYDTGGVSPTPCTKDESPKVETEGGEPKNVRIRNLTPRECWRLMGFPDWAYDRAKAVPMGKTGLYKQAGNSIAVPCLVAIFRGMFIEGTWVRSPRIEDYNKN